MQKGLSQNDFFSSLKELQAQFTDMLPALELTVSDPSMDVEGYVVVWNTDICKDGPLFDNKIGCGKGGTRITPDLKLDDVKRLARAMCEKNAAAGLPLGGAKSGLRADPYAPDYEEKWKRFVQLVKDKGVLYEDGGIFGGFGYDIGGKPPLNALWTMDQLGSGRSFTGKPIEHGGTDYDKIGIAGLGVAIAGKTLLEQKGFSAKDATFSIQGVGAMGGAVLRYFSEHGGILKSLSDVKYGGTWVFDKPVSQSLIDNPSPEAVAAEGNKISDDPAGALYDNVQITFPCALEDSITMDNVAKIKAHFIAEGANNPTTDDAHQYLFDNNTLVAPDILSNAGGIIAAFVEMTSPSENKADEAIVFTEKKVTANIVEMISYINRINVRPDLVADYMTYKNIFKGE